MKKVFSFKISERYIVITFLFIKITIINSYNLKKLSKFIEEVINNLKLIIFNLYYAGKKTVLIVEFQRCHGETIPSFIKFFNDLNYDVILLMNNDLNYEKVLYKFKFRKKVKSFYFSQKIILSKILVNNNIYKKYNIIFFNTMVLYKKDKMESLFCDYNLNTDKVIAIDHNVFRDFNRNIDKDKLIVLLPNNSGLKYVNPHYFGSRKCRTKNKVVRLVLAARRVESARNMHLLIDSVKSIVDRGVLNFELLCVGNIINLNIDIKGYENNIKYIGALNYYDFYNVIESSDFILPMLDPDIESHKRFLVDVSGTFQLVYGFGIIPIVHRVFSSRYGINNDNGLIYDSNDFIIDSLLEAINMSFEEYEIKRNNIFKYADILEKESLENLKYIISRAEQSRAEQSRAEQSRAEQ